MPGQLPCQVRANSHGTSAAEVWADEARCVIQNAGAVVGIAGLGFALTKLDPGFSKVLYETVIKVGHLHLVYVVA